MEDLKQVNISVDVNGNETYWISNWSPEGYKGVLTDTVYVDGSSYTDWGVFVGTLEECQTYVDLPR